jgi:hypothetical protein
VGRTRTSSNARMANASIRSHAGSRICSLPPDRFRLGGLVLIFVLPPSAPRPFRQPASRFSHIRICSRQSQRWATPRSKCSREGVGYPLQHFRIATFPLCFEADASLLHLVGQPVVLIQSDAG